MEKAIIKIVACIAIAAMFIGILIAGNVSDVTVLAFISLMAIVIIACKK